MIFDNGLSVEDDSICDRHGHATVGTLLRVREASGGSPCDCRTGNPNLGS